MVNALILHLFHKRLNMAPATLTHIQVLPINLPVVSMPLWPHTMAKLSTHPTSFNSMGAAPLFNISNTPLKPNSMRLLLLNSMRLLLLNIIWILLLGQLNTSLLLLNLPKTSFVLLRDAQTTSQKHPANAATATIRVLLGTRANFQTRGPNAKSISLLFRHLDMCG